MQNMSKIHIKRILSVLQNRDKWSSPTKIFARGQIHTIQSHWRTHSQQSKFNGWTKIIKTPLHDSVTIKRSLKRPLKNWHQDKYSLIFCYCSLELWCFVSDWKGKSVIGWCHSTNWNHYWRHWHWCCYSQCCFWIYFEGPWHLME